MSDVGFRKWMNLDYEVMEDGHAVVSCPLDDDKVNVRGVGHGGIVASLIDIAMGTAVSGGNYSTRIRFCVTLEMKVNYLAPAAGERLIATADTIRAGGRTHVVRCDCRTDRGEIVATALGTFMTRRQHEGDRASAPAG